MNCDNCGAPMRLVPGKDYFVCDYCTAFHFPGETADGVRVLEGQSDLECPVCRRNLVHGSIDGRPLLTCPDCQGVLAGQAAFAAVIETRRALHQGPPLPPKSLSPEEFQRHLLCPRCRKPMDVHPYHGPGNVMIDSCGDCGLVWTDRGEITIIVST